MTAQRTVCLWYPGDALEAARLAMLPKYGQIHAAERYRAVA